MSGPEEQINKYMDQLGNKILVFATNRF
ncbi:hypothetical protein ACEW7V_03275 [Areca yellow leaf disease phytoplasma]